MLARTIRLGLWGAREGNPSCKGGVFICPAKNHACRCMRQNARFDIRFAYECAPSSGNPSRNGPMPVQIQRSELAAIIRRGYDESMATQSIAAGGHKAGAGSFTGRLYKGLWLQYTSTASATHFWFWGLSCLSPGVQLSWPVTAPILCCRPRRRCWWVVPPCLTAWALPVCAATEVVSSLAAQSYRIHSNAAMRQRLSFLPHNFSHTIHRRSAEDGRICRVHPL
jgi:hypothetical protein